MQESEFFQSNGLYNIQTYHRPHIHPPDKDTEKAKDTVSENGIEWPWFDLSEYPNTWKTHTMDMWLVE